MITTNNYWCFESALDSLTCDKIVNLGKEQLKKLQDLGISTEAVTNGHNHKQFMEKIEKNLKPRNNLSVEDIKNIENISGENIENTTYIRDSEVAWLNYNWLYDLILPYVELANQKAGWKYDWKGSEAFQFTKYNSPGGFYGWHQDSCGDHNSTYKRYIPGVHPEINEKEFSLKRYTTNKFLVNKVRKLSVTINLNEPNDYEGGNLKFDFGPHASERYHECVEIRPRGSIIVFPSHIYHQVTPVTKGTRYSLVLWCLGYPFK